MKLRYCVFYFNFEIVGRKDIIDCGGNDREGWWFVKG